MRLYAKNFVIATSAREVMGAEVEDDRITCRKGCRRDGISKLLISVDKFSHVYKILKISFINLYILSDRFEAEQRQTSEGYPACFSPFCP